MAYPNKQGLYDPGNEHDACGVGFIANIKGLKTHDIVRNGLEILRNIDHRGAVGADPLVGDGAGILIQIPDSLYRDWAAGAGVALPQPGDYGVAMCFLPRDPAAEAALVGLDRAVVQGRYFTDDEPVIDVDLGAGTRVRHARRSIAGSSAFH